MKKIIFTRPDGGVSVVTPVINTHPVPEQITEDEAVVRAWSKLPADAIAPRVVETSEVPTDRAFRNAWRDSGSAVVCDLDRAKSIARDHLRAERTERFKQLDGQWMRAQGRGERELAAEIEAKRELLRNWPTDPRITAAGSTDELKTALQTMKKENLP